MSNPSSAPSGSQESAVSDPGTVCQSCGAYETGRYCSECGQRQRRDRFTFPSIFSTALAELVNLERGALKTIYGLSTRPARVIRDYWNRRTRLYVNPVRYFLFAIAFFQIVLWQTGGASAMVRGFLDASQDGDEGLRDITSQAEALQVFGDYFVAFFAVGVLVLTALSRLGSPRNAAEEFIMHLYAWGHLAFLWGLLTIVGHLLSFGKPLQAAYGGGVLLLTLSYYVWTHVRSHQPDTERSYWREGLEALALLLLFAVLYTALAGFTTGVVIQALHTQ